MDPISSTTAPVPSSSSVPPVASSSTTSAPSASSSQPQPPIKNLILDAAPLLTQFPLRGLASKYIIAPQVLAEIRDKRAREHFERLGLLEGVEIEVRDVDLVSLAKVTAFAKQTGDYAVLSHTDLCVLALTYAVEVEENGHWRVRDELGKPPAGRPVPASASASANASTTAPAPTSPSKSNNSSAPASSPSKHQPATTTASITTSGSSSTPGSSILPSTSSWGKRPASNPASVSAPTSVSAPASNAPEDQKDANGEVTDNQAEKDVPADDHIVESISQRLDRATLEASPAPVADPQPSASSSSSVATTTAVVPPSLPSTAQAADAEAESDSDDSNSEDDEEEGGAWITPSNVSTHKAKDLGLALPEANQTGGKARKSAILKSACMTSDFAVQNVLLQMGLNLVGGEGRRIRSVKSWVLRCHACFKLCKDPSKKFCPSCGGPTLIRTSITTSAPTDGSSEQTTTVHLKKNFQYHTRGTRYSIPLPKAGSSKGQKHGGSGLVLREDQAEWQRGVRMEQGRKAKADRLVKKSLESGGNGAGGSGSWLDADWMPEMYSVGMSGKGRRSENGGGRDGGFLPKIGHGRKNPNSVRRK
ncbi:Predicted RNA-binding protein Nob1p involved in 26S proteasome assembly [Phaffia rhodozyma]|uniref:20S-pre-rRNA D-site endonuclease NOB1 n=1 Tax=Phaffia rhodozyma TaxID=264483 RepID=A0A0F7SK01_PHARH|nr:Predicted RNA-binding protein Nob1p involved in 26S proteasome assembly [Phaffia rhodozyma]